jgi:hypothetical protein
MISPFFTGWLSRVRMLCDWVSELRNFGAPRETGDPACGTVFLLDGVGGFLLTPTLARKAFRQAALPFATYLFDWHRGVRGEMLADLACLRANRRAGLRLARVIRRRVRQFPGAPVHVLSYSAGAGIAVFAAEKLGRRAHLDVLVLAAPALSPAYPLGAALQHVRACYVLASRRDYLWLGLGTSLFGTIDRRHTPAAGLRGFRSLASADHASELAARGRFIEFWWGPELCALGHAGHHVGPASVPFVRERIVPLLRNVPRPQHPG